MASFVPPAAHRHHAGHQASTGIQVVLAGSHRRSTAHSNATLDITSQIPFSATISNVNGVLTVD